MARNNVEAAGETMSDIVIIPAAAPDMTTAEGRRKKINPAGVYLASFPSKKSQRDMGYALSKFSRRFFRLFNEDTGLWNFGGFDLKNPLEEDDKNPDVLRWKKTDWRQLRAEHVEMSQAWVRSNGNGQSSEGQYVNALRGVIGKCYELGQVDAGVESMARKVKAPKPNDYKPGRALEHHEMVRLFNALEQEPNPVRRARDYAVLALMAWAGLRIVDTQNLTTQDVLEGGKVILLHRKGRRVQKMALNPIVTGPLNDWLKIRGADQGPVICQIGKGTVIKQSEGLSSTYYSTLVKKYADLAAIGEITPHDLRSTFATRLADLGVRIEVISELLGHSKIENTVTYLRKLDKTAAKTITELDIMKAPNV